MGARLVFSPGFTATFFAGLVVVLAGCSQGVPGSSPTQTAAPGRSASSTGNPACDLITQDIAVKIDPGLTPLPNSPARPGGSKAYLCGYYSRSAKGNHLSVALTTPASAAEIAETRNAPDCAPVTGIGDFACFQWTGYFRGEPGGASANTILKAVRGKEALDFRFLAMPPIGEGIPVPDGSATAKALAQALASAGWGNGSPLSVPSAPAVGSQPSTNNPVCALLSAGAVKQAFGATTQAQVLPGEGSCRYTFGSPGTPGPDSLIFSIEYHQGGASALSGPLPPDGQRIDGVGDSAVLVARSEPADPKSLRPTGDVPVTVLALMVARGQNMAIFTAQILVSPAGPTADQIKDQLVTLVAGVDF